MNLRKSISLIILFAVLVALPVAGRYTRYFTGAPDRPAVIRPSMDEIAVPTPPANHVSDRLIRSDGQPVLVDLAHDNQLELAELNVLAGRLATRGSRLVPWTDGDLTHHLATAGALVVVAPLQPYDEDEIEAITHFVETGGRLLLIGDPTRYHYRIDPAGTIAGIESDVISLNQLSAIYGLTFVDDYLYNVIDNEGNFRNIRLDEWGGGALYEGLGTVVFYAAHSLSADEEMAVIRADKDTWSSATDRAGGLVVAAQAAAGQLLALGDLTFMTEPYHTVRDNGLLISRIADFLTAGRRTYGLREFPLFFDREVVLNLTNSPELGPGQLQLVDRLQGAFEAGDRRLLLSDSPDATGDAVLAGLYSQHEPVDEFLSAHGVTLTITATITETSAGAHPEDETLTAGTPESESQGAVDIVGFGSYDMSGTALLLLHQGDDYQILTILSASQDGLANVVDRLISNDLDDCVEADAVMLCPSGVDDEPIQLEWVVVEVPAEPEADTDTEMTASAELEGEIGYGDSVMGDLGAGEIHRWSFAGATGDVVSISVEPLDGDLDLVLELHDADEQLLSTVDQGGTGVTESISAFELSATAEYVILLSEQDGQPGEYELTLELVSTTDSAELTGAIDFGETVEGSLAAGDSAVWSFGGVADQGITIIVQPDGNGDLVVELQDSDGDPLVVADDAFEGEEERIEGLLPGDDEYRIVIREFYGEPIDYRLSLQAGGEGPILGGRGILVVSADVGDALLEGRTGADVYVNLLSPDYDVTLWSLADDGELDADALAGYQLLIWASGDYVGDFESFAPMLYFVEGNAILISGVSLGFLGDGETATLSDVTVSASSSPLTAGFAPDQLIALLNEIEAPVFGATADEEGVIPVFLRGPSSQEAGDLIAAAFDDVEFGGGRFMLIGFPIYLLPEEARAQVVANAIEWFGVDRAP